jgi:hypothetical protein
MRARRLLAPVTAAHSLGAAGSRNACIASRCTPVKIMQVAASLRLRFLSVPSLLLHRRQALTTVYPRDSQRFTPCLPFKQDAAEVRR